VSCSRTRSRAGDCRSPETPRNHSALLSGEQIDALRAATGLDVDTEWDRFDPGSKAGVWDTPGVSNSIRNSDAGLPVAVPETTGQRSTKPDLHARRCSAGCWSTSARDEHVAPYLVTTAPDVATSTNLAGFLNKTVCFRPRSAPVLNEDRNAAAGPRGPGGQAHRARHLGDEPVPALGQLGLAWDLSAHRCSRWHGVRPRSCSGLDAFLYGTYSGSRFVVAGTPSGITLAPEGGAHQSTITASVGLELPGVTFCEPAYAGALDWLLCHALGRIAAGPTSPATAMPAEDGAYYFRLSTRPLDQAPFEAARARFGDAVLRRQVLSGAYRLVDAALAHPDLAGAPTVHLVGSGAVLPEVLAAAAELADEGIAAHVVDVTSLDRLYSAWQRTLRQGVRTATAPSLPGVLRTALSRDRAPRRDRARRRLARHGLDRVGARRAVRAARRRPVRPVRLGAELYELHDLLPGSIVNGALAALSLS
jgi:pyruvate dehydrogenase E1 component